MCPNPIVTRRSAKMTKEYNLLILNGMVLTDTEIGEFDIAVKSEKIAKVVPRGALSGASAKQTIDAQGGYVMVSYPVYLHGIRLTMSNSQEASILMFISMCVSRDVESSTHLINS